nr:transposase [Methylobacterium sp. Leaf111]
MKQSASSRWPRSLRDEFLNGKVFYTLKEASVVIEQWRKHYNTVRPHSSLSDQPPALEVIICPMEPNGSVPSARPAIVTRSTMH